MDYYKLPAYCPTCGQANPVKHSPEWLMTHFRGMISNILACLIKARKDRRSVSMRELVEAAYIDDPEGGPADPVSSVKIAIWRKREALNKLGWDIVGPRITRNGYQLVELERP